MGFSLCGPIDASALFYFHGQGTSRLQGLAFAKIVEEIIEDLSISARDQRYM